MLDSSSIMVSMNRLSNKDRARVVSCLVEGCSIRATVKMTTDGEAPVNGWSLDRGRSSNKSA